VVLRAAEKAKKKEVVVVAALLSLQEELLTQIRDLLKVISATLYIQFILNTFQDHVIGGFSSFFLTPSQINFFNKSLFCNILLFFL
jgi:hypothetical protein